MAGRQGHGDRRETEVRRLAQDPPVASGSGRPEFAVPAPAVLRSAEGASVSPPAAATGSAGGSVPHSREAGRCCGSVHTRPPAPLRWSPSAARDPSLHLASSRETARECPPGCDPGGCARSISRRWPGRQPLHPRCRAAWGGLGAGNTPFWLFQVGPIDGPPRQKLSGNFEALPL